MVGAHAGESRRGGHERLRVDVDDGRQPAPAQRGARGGEQRRRAARERAGLVGLRDELGSVAAPQAQQRRRPEQRPLDAVQTVAHLAKHLGDAGRVGPGRDDRDEVADRRIAECRPPLELLGEEPRDVVALRELEGHRVRLERLHENEPRRVASAPSGELRDELERPLLRAEVGDREPRVGVDDGGEIDAGKVVALRDHLRADQHGAVAPRNRAIASRRAPGRAAVSASSRIRSSSGTFRSSSCSRR